MNQDEHTCQNTQYQKGRVISTFSHEEVEIINQTGEEISADMEVSEDAWIEEAETLEPVFNTRKSSLLRKAFFLSLCIALCTEAGLTLYYSFTTSILLGVLYSCLFVTGLTLIGKLVFKEFRLLRKLKRNHLQRNEAARLLNSEQIGEALPWLEKLNKYKKIEGFSDFKQSLQQHHSDREVMELYCSSILTKQDEVAQNLVNKYALESGLLVAISPLALVDMAAVLWRGSKLVEEISLVYGIPLGYASRINLYRQLFKQMLFAGSAELVSDLATTALSAELAGKLSSRAAQGISTGVLTARIGYKAMELSRPVPKLTKKKGLLSGTTKLLLTNLIKKTSKN